MWAMPKVRMVAASRCGSVPAGRVKSWVMAGAPFVRSRSQVEDVDRSALCIAGLHTVAGECGQQGPRAADLLVGLVGEVRRQHGQTFDGLFQPQRGAPVSAGDP